MSEAPRPLAERLEEMREDAKRLIAQAVLTREVALTMKLESERDRVMKMADDLEEIAHHIWRRGMEARSN